MYCTTYKDLFIDDCVVDVLRDQSDPNKFIFYEVYKSSAAIDHHKKQAHYQAWADFKEKGIVTSVTTKADGEFMT
jgi:quinol monooxygenase YgiN